MNRKRFPLARKFFVDVLSSLPFLEPYPDNHAQLATKYCRSNAIHGPHSSRCSGLLHRYACRQRRLSKAMRLRYRCRPNAWNTDNLHRASPRQTRFHEHPTQTTNSQCKGLFQKELFGTVAPGIESYLRDHEIYHVLICGLETPICIYQTALQSIDEDIDATFLADALGCRRTEDGRLAIEAIRQLGCQTLPSETVFYSLLGSATHPNFRSFSKLVATYSNSSISTQKILSEKPDTARIRSQSSSSGTSKGSGKKQRGPKSEATENKKASSTTKKKLAKKRTSQSGKRNEAPIR